MDAEKLIQHDRWWGGPNWLLEPESFWPTSSASIYECPEPYEEWTLSLTAFVTTTHVSQLPVLHQVSSYNRLKQITAWEFQLVHNSRHPGSTKSLMLSFGELQESQNLLDYHGTTVGLSGRTGTTKLQQDFTYIQQAQSVADSGQTQPTESRR